MTFISDDDYSKLTGKKSLVEQIKSVWYFIAAGAVLLIGYDRWGMFSYDLAVMYAISLLIMVSLFKNALNYFKLNTAKLICNPIFTTTSGNYFNAGPYKIFTIGDIRAGTQEWQGKEGCIIGPATAVYKVGKSVYFNIKVSNTKFSRLPLSVKKAIIDNSLSGPYFFGLANEDSYPQLPDLTKIIDQLENQNEHISELQTMLDQKGRTIENHQSSMARIKRRLMGTQQKKEEEQW